MNAREQPGLMSDLQLLLRLLVIVGALAVSVWALLKVPQILRGDEGSPGPPVGEVYADVLAAMTRDGMVVMVSETLETSDPVVARRGTERHWIDATNGAARTERVYESFGTITTVSVIRDGMTHSLGEDGKRYKQTVGCSADRPAALSVFGACFDSFPNDIRVDSRTGTRFGGRETDMIRWRGDSHGTDSTVHIHQRLYIDAETKLPLAFKSSTADEYALGGTTRRSYVRRFRHEFVPRASLPAEFFDPSEASYSVIERPISPP